MAERLYRRARRDLTDAQRAMIARGREVIAARYVRRAPGTLVRQARLAKLAANEGVTYAVLAERAAGASWAELATAANQDETFMRDHYAPIEAKWRKEHTIAPNVHVIEPAALSSIG